METPSRDYYRYLLLCGHSLDSIVEEFDKNRLFMPPAKNEYYNTQFEWATNLLGTGSQTVSTAVRRAGMYDMLASTKDREAGDDCLMAYHLLSVPLIRKPLEILIASGYMDQEIEDRINSTATHHYSVRRGVVKAYRRYFFNPDILDMNSKIFLSHRNEAFAFAIHAMDPDTIEYKAGIRTRSDMSPGERLKEAIINETLIRLQRAPISTDPESFKAITAASSILRYVDEKKEVNDALNKIIDLTKKETDTEIWEEEE